MCTLTYIPLSEGCLFTSNRDERRLRAPALPPALYTIHGRSILFPKDQEAGGTWIASSDTLQLCLLNGAFDRHIPNPPYRLSRGIVLLDAFGYEDFHAFFEKYSFTGIEPFSLIAIETKDSLSVKELRWDGKHVFYKTLDPSKPAIWSSATLYTSEIREKRESWFSAFMEQNPHPSQEEILDFHQFTGDGDKENDLVMEKSDFLRTLSITSLYYRSGERKLTHLDLVEGERYDQLIAHA